MRWQNRRQSSNVEVRRGRTLAVGGGGVVTLVIVLIALFTGQDPTPLLNQVGGPAAGPGQVSPAQEPLRQFVSVVLADTEDVWGDLLPRHFNRPYAQPRLVIFSGRVESACGLASAAVGPFYCPADQRAYLDLGFFQEMRDRFGAPGDFAMAYVVAHEIGHHVQNLLGISDQVQAARAKLSEAEYNRLSVRLELQADFLAGCWAHHAQRSKNILEPGDLEEALNAANAIGDDALQKQGQGYVVPDSFTHGTSRQRVRWFREGFDSGAVTRMGELFELRDEQL